MTAVGRVTVDLYDDDPRLIALLDPDERPEVLTTPTATSLVPYEAAFVRELPPGEPDTAVVIDWLTERVLVVQAEAPGEYVAAVHPEATDELAHLLRA